jgi:AmiR/NasT family two-component response regulator
LSARVLRQTPAVGLLVQTYLVTINVFLVDDHAIVRRGLEELINDEDDMCVVGEAGRATDAANRIGATSPDVVKYGIDFQPWRV